ncbi:hypothetical protein BaRGS_00021554 [Batillaria attramentaria]|uniref:LRAT domain-containing protein n=1 Tax=Batillaria attramentaria TaxID=370345 RepID=A0ABD0KJF6_9CAEN
MANRRDNELLPETPQLGDRIKIKRVGGVYYHFGIYVGDSRVVHLGLAGRNSLDCFCLDSLCSPSGVIKSKAVVREDNIFDVVRGGVADRDNSLDSWLPPLAPEEVVKRAKNELGRTGYNLLTSNCEHFATWCRYGISESEQVENVKSALQSIRSSNELSETEKDILLLSLSFLICSATYRYFAHAKEDTDYYPRSKPSFRAHRKCLRRHKMKSKNCTSVHERIYQSCKHGNAAISKLKKSWMRFQKRCDQRLCNKIIQGCRSARTNRSVLLIVQNPCVPSSAGFETDTYGCVAEKQNGREPHPLKYMQVCYQTDECETDESTPQSKSTGNTTEDIVDLFFPYGLQTSDDEFEETRHCHFTGYKSDDEYETADEEIEIFDDALFDLCGNQKKGQSSELHMNFTRSGSPADCPTALAGDLQECPLTLEATQLCTAEPSQECSSAYQAASCRVGTDETKPKPECKRKTKTSDQEVADRITHAVMEFRFQRLWYIPMDIVRNFWQGFKDYMFRTSSHDHKPAPEVPPAANYEEVNCIYESFCLADSQSVWSNSTARNECSPPASPCYTLDSCTPICYPFQCTPIQYTPIQCPPIPYIPIQCTPIQCTPMNYSISSPCAGWLN